MPKKAMNNEPLPLVQQRIIKGKTLKEKFVKKRSALITMILLALPGLGFASDKTAAPLKLGVLDWQQLVAKSPQAEMAGKRLEKEFKGRKDTFMAKQKDYEAKQEKLQRDKDIMSEIERTKAERELTKLQQELRNLQEENQSDYSIRHREEMDKFLNIVKSIVDEYSKKEQYDVILPQDTTLFAADRVDITQNILDKLKADKKSQ